MTAINPTISTNDLRQFAYLFGGMFALVFGLLIPWLWDKPWPLLPWYVAALFFAWGTIHPRSLGPIYAIWMKIGSVLGWINTRIILGIVFYLVVLPTGLMMKLFGKDAMARKLKADKPSYRIDSNKRDAKSMERPF